MVTSRDATYTVLCVTSRSEPVNASVGFARNARNSMCAAAYAATHRARNP